MRGEVQNQEVNEAAGKKDRYNIADTLLCVCVIEISFGGTR